MLSADDIVKIIISVQAFADKDPILCFWALFVIGIPPILKYSIELYSCIKKGSKDD